GHAAPTAALFAADCATRGNAVPAQPRFLDPARRHRAAATGPQAALPGSYRPQLAADESK
ncbi:hypothetical protein TSOC_012875, partial [Tetrabaena socialis]